MTREERLIQWLKIALGISAFAYVVWRRRE